MQQPKQNPKPKDGLKDSERIFTNFDNETKEQLDDIDLPSQKYIRHSKVEVNGFLNVELKTKTPSLSMGWNKLKAKIQQVSSSASKQSDIWWLL